MSAPFFSLRRPEAGLSGDIEVPFSYPDVGATRTGPPSGWTVDREEAVIGRGHADFVRARDAVRQWRMFELGWGHLLTKPTPASGAEVIFASRHLGVWARNRCRVVYVIDEEDELRARYGFAYGTLADHAVAGDLIQRLRNLTTGQNAGLDGEPALEQLPELALARLGGGEQQHAERVGGAGARYFCQARGRRAVDLNPRRTDFGRQSARR